MTRTLALILALATPAHAVTLDPVTAAYGDLIWTNEGFRPADGIDAYAGKINPPVKPVCKPMYDSLRPDARTYLTCDKDRGVFAQGLPLAGGSYRSAHSGAVTGGRDGRDGFDGFGSTTITGDTITVTVTTPCGCVVTPEPPPPVPLPASAWLLLAGLIAMRRMKS